MRTLHFCHRKACALAVGCIAWAVTAGAGEAPAAPMAPADRDGDGRISRQEFPGPPTLFDRLDADRDGFLSRVERQDGLRQGRPASANPNPASLGIPWTLVDGNQDGRITPEEWEEFFKQTDRNADRVLTADEMAAPRSRGAQDRAPQVGDPAPRVSAKTLREGTEVDLSRPRRLTVLVFGSHT